MASKLKRPGLKLDLNVKQPVDLLKPSSSTGTSATSNWREDIAKMVTKNKSMTDIRNAAGGLVDASTTKNNSQQDSTNGSSSEDDNVKPEDFENIQKLGEGAAGAVWKVKHKPTGIVMAKKVMYIYVKNKGERE